MKYLPLGLALTMLTAVAFAAEPGDAALPRVRLQTTQGDIVLELEKYKAPKTVENFLTYVRDGAYNETLFHRVIKDFMIQGGGFTPTYERRPMRAPIGTESDNGLKNERGTVGMARLYNPNSATNQFFINVVNNQFMNYHAPTLGFWGYTVFGRVIEGMDVIDYILAIPTGPGGPFATDVPQTPVIITKATIEPEAPTVTKTGDGPKEKKVSGPSTKKTSFKSGRKPSAKLAKKKQADQGALQSKGYRINAQGIIERAGEK